MSATPSSPATPKLPHDEVIPILDFGSQPAQLIARRLRELGVFSWLVSPNITPEQLLAMKPKGIVLSGGPSSVYEKGAPTCDKRIFDMGVPVMGICYGMQLAAHLLGGKVTGADHREFGRAHLAIADAKHPFMKGVPDRTTVWMSHGDQVTDTGGLFNTLASTPTCPNAVVISAKPDRQFVGVQFHPEVTHTPHGVDLLRNFVYDICKCKGGWRMSDFANHAAARVRERVGSAQVVCGLSGGVDSAVVAALLDKAIGPQLHCVFVDTGLLRNGERDLVESTFRDHFKIDLKVVDAEKEFLSDLAGITDPQEKRRRIGHRFIDVFKHAAKSIPNASFLAQGTLYPDVIESVSFIGGPSVTIKSHHNVGGLPERMRMKLVEPLRELFKDEVRDLGRELGLPETLVGRHPFPGPGLAIRVPGAIDRDKLAILRKADMVYLEEIRRAGLYDAIWQAFAVLLPVKTVGVMGDARSYDYVCALRAVTSTDGMTAESYPFDHAFLAATATRIINEVRGINRVVYDVTSKPPGTIEWE